MKSLPGLVFTLFSIACASNAISATYVWEMDEGIATFGDGINPSPQGSYTKSWIGGPYMGTGGSYNGFNEGPYDGRSGVIRSYISAGTSTRTDPNAIFDLSAVGSSATIRTVYHAIGSQNSSTGSGHIYQFGLTSNADYFGAPNDESLFIAADFQGYNQTTDIVTVDLDIFDHLGADQAPTDGNWNVNPLVNVATGLEIDRLYTGTAVSHAIELIYTNIGNGQLAMSVGIMELDISGRLASDTVTATNLAVAQVFTLPSSTFTDLSMLRPGFGLSLSDPDIPMSGANYDWQPEYPTNFAPLLVPEPSRAVLCLTGIFALLMRRGRRLAS